MTTRTSIAPTLLPDDDTLEMVSMKLSARHREWLRIEAFRRRTSKTDIVRALIEAEIAKQDAA